MEKNKFETLIQNDCTKYFGTGIGIGFFDAFQIGAPLIGTLSGAYYFLPTIFKKTDNLSKEEKAIINTERKGSLLYILGNSIPYIIKYHNEIFETANQLLSKF